jgi:hypothetical protein
MVDMKQKISLLLVMLILTLTISPILATEQGTQPQTLNSITSRLIGFLRMIEKPGTRIAFLGPEMILQSAITAKQTLQNQETAGTTQTASASIQSSVTEELSEENSALNILRSVFARPAEESKPVHQDGVNQSDLERLRCWIASFNRNLSPTENYNIAKWILEDCEKYNVDWKVAASLFAAESAYRPNAVSPVGARGLGQLMPETARDLGVTNSFDVRQNIEGSVRYVARNLGRWHGFSDQLNRTLASYNAGFGAVTRFNGIPPYRETINYVSKINGYIGELNNPRIECFRNHHLASNRATSCPIDGHNHGNVARQR